MAKAKRRSFEREYVQVPNETAQAVQAKENDSPLSLEALGLLVNLWSYPETWELHKTELYKRFAFNKESSVSKAWKQLIKTGYMVEYKYRVGKKWEYEYVYNILPYTEEQRRIIWDEGREEHGEIWGLDFQDLKMRTSNCGPQNPEIINTKAKKDVIKEKQTKEIKDIVNKELDNLPENSLSKNDLIDIANEFYSEFAVGRWTKKHWITLTDKFATEIIDGDVEIANPRKYIHTSIKNMAYKHDLKSKKPESDGKYSLYDFINKEESE